MGHNKEVTCKSCLAATDDNMHAQKRAGTSVKIWIAFIGPEVYLRGFRNAGMLFYKALLSTS